jgi:hypothetical protein
MPRLGTRSRSRWSDGQRPLGTPAVLGAAATAATVVGTWRERDVEYDGSCLGVLEQQDLDAALTGRHHVDQSATTAISLPRR